MLTNKKAISTLTLIILIATSAVIGGIISYMLTIAHYVEMEYNIPENETVLTITNVYINPEDASSFTITVLNPSFSVSNATITGIAVSVAENAELYEVVRTLPLIGDGLTVAIGEAVNLTCSIIEMEEKQVNWGEFAYQFAGQYITIHVFSEEASAANIKVRLPYVRLYIVPNLQPEESFQTFELNLKNDETSETNLTISEIFLRETKVNDTIRQFPLETVPKSVTPELPHSLMPGETQSFVCELNWLGIYNTTLVIVTQEGYRIYQEIEPPQTYFLIEDVVFDEDDLEHFKIIVKNRFDSAGKVTLTNITYSLDDGTVGHFEEVTPSLPKDIPPMLSLTFTCTWNWREYRGRDITIIIHISQGFNRSITKATPNPVLLQLLYQNETFNLKDHEHFNITLHLHEASLESLNITKIEVEHIVLKGNLTTPELPYAYLNPGQTMSFYCNYDWTGKTGENLTITIYAVGAETEKEYTFTFNFTLPKAELNVSSVSFISSGIINCLNITIKNANYSILDLTIIEVIVSFDNGTVVLEKQWSPEMIVLAPGESHNLIFEVGDMNLENVDVTIRILTEEGVETVWSGIPSSTG